MSKRRAQFKVNYEFELPSGNVVLLKPVSMFDLAAQGEIPQSLTAAAEEVTNRSGNGGLNLEQMKEYTKVVNAVAIACFVDPPLAEAESEEYLAVGDLSFVDKLSVFQWANQGPQALKPFRGESAGVPNAL